MPEPIIATFMDIVRIDFGCEIEMELEVDVQRKMGIEMVDGGGRSWG